jgi:CMP-N,N'-diacetyllegionaminic acid synthase
MIEGRRVLAVVPARSGSKGVADKNVRQLRGLSLIGWAARILNQLDYIDARIISTDSPQYAEEAVRHGLDAPFLRPPELSSDTASVVDAVAHALLEMEKGAGSQFEIVLVIEPTSPLRMPEDVSRTMMRLISEGRDSALAVSPLDPKWHPRKALQLVGGRVESAIGGEVTIVGRQKLGGLYWRNGVCYAVTRDCLLNDRLIIGRNCGAEVIQHPVANIDSEWEFDWAEFLLKHGGEKFLRAVSLA